MRKGEAKRTLLQPLGKPGINLSLRLHKSCKLIRRQILNGKEREFFISDSPRSTEWRVAAWAAAEQQHWIKVWQHKWPSIVTLCSATRKNGFKAPHKLLIFLFYISVVKSKDEADQSKMAPRNSSEKPPHHCFTRPFHLPQMLKSRQGGNHPIHLVLHEKLTVVMSIYKYQLLHEAGRLLVIVAVW